MTNTETKRINIELVFKDFETEIEFRRKKISPQISLKTINEPCPCRECINGGFTIDFSTPSGKIICQGWQDRERINKHRCLTILEYNIVDSPET